MSEYSPMAVGFRAGRVAQPNVESNMPQLHYHNSYEFYYLESGERNYIINDQFFKVRSGDVVLVSPFDLHRTGGGGYSRILIEFQVEYLRNYFCAEMIKELMACFDSHLIRVPKEKAVFLRLMLERILKERSEAARCLHLGEILQLLGSVKGGQQDQTYSPNQKISEVLTFIQQHYQEIHSISVVADRFYLNKYYLCRLFKKTVGVSLMDYVNSVKIKAACEQLVHTQRSVTEICYASGFNSAAYFCRVFKNITGLTPSMYKRL